jgi:hypothetical protein
MRTTSWATDTLGYWERGDTSTAAAGRPPHLKAPVLERDGGGQRIPGGGAHLGKEYRRGAYPSSAAAGRPPSLEARIFKRGCGGKGRADNHSCGGPTRGLNGFEPMGGRRDGSEGKAIKKEKGDYITSSLRCRGKKQRRGYFHKVNGARGSERMSVLSMRACVQTRSTSPSRCCSHFSDGARRVVAGQHRRSSPT